MKDWYQISETEALAQLKTGRSGLSREEAGKRLKEYGKNRLRAVSYTHLDVYKRQALRDW